MMLGNLQTALKKLAATQGDLLESGEERLVITGIFLANKTAGALTVTLDLTRGGVDYNICTAKNVAANDYVHIQGDHGPIASMQDGDILKGSCSSANNVHAVITYTEIGGPSG